MGSRHEPNILELERATGRPPYLLRKSAPAAVDSPRIHGDDGEDFVELAAPKSPALDGAGNGTSAYLLRKSVPASGACRRLRLLATNASRLFYARTLAGSSPGALLKKARHRNGVVLLLFLERATGLEPASVSLGS